MPMLDRGSVRDVLARAGRFLLRYQVFVVTLVLLFGGLAYATRVYQVSKHSISIWSNLGQYLAMPVAAVAVLISAWAVHVTRRIADEIGEVSAAAASAAAEVHLHTQWQNVNAMFPEPEKCRFFVVLDREIQDYLAKIGIHALDSHGDPTPDAIRFVQEFLFVCYILQTMNDGRSYVLNGTLNDDRSNASFGYWGPRIMKLHSRVWSFIKDYNRGFGDLITDIEARNESGDWTIAAYRAGWTNGGRQRTEF